MRARVWLLALASCVDAGQSIGPPDSSFDLAFLVWTEGSRVRRVSEPFAAEAGEPIVIPGGALTRRETEAISLVGLTMDQLRSVNILFDEARSLESRLYEGTDQACAARFSPDGLSVSSSLPSTALVEALSPESSEPTARDRLPASLRLQLPLANRACDPPAQSRPFAQGGLALVDGFLAGGVPQSSQVVGEKNLFEIRDAQYVTDDEAIIFSGTRLFILPRGGRLQSDAEEGVFHPRQLGPPGDADQDPHSFAILPNYSNATRQRILLVFKDGRDAPDFRTWVSTIEREGNQVTVLGSLMIPGTPIRVEVDALGRAILGGRGQDSETHSTVLWTGDGLSFEQREMQFLVGGVATTPDPDFPHLLHDARRAILHLGDLTQLEGPPLIELALDTTFLDGIRSVGATRVGNKLRLFVGGEGPNAVYMDFAASTSFARTWMRIPLALDASTRAAGCSGLPEACGAVDVSPELDELHAFTDAQGRSWFFTITKLCAHLHAIRSDGCTTHLPLEPVLPIAEERSMLSIRVAPDGKKALARTRVRTLSQAAAGSAAPQRIGGRSGQDEHLRALRRTPGRPLDPKSPIEAVAQGVGVMRPDQQRRVRSRHGELELAGTGESEQKRAGFECGRVELQLEDQPASESLLEREGESGLRNYAFGGECAQLSVWRRAIGARLAALTFLIARSDVLAATRGVRPFGGTRKADRVRSPAPENLGAAFDGAPALISIVVDRVPASELSGPDVVGHAKASVRLNPSGSGLGPRPATSVCDSQGSRRCRPRGPDNRAQVGRFVPGVDADLARVHRAHGI